jgi:hypothetical protein
VHCSSLAMSAEAQSSSHAPPFRQGALDADEIRRDCPKFRILVIGKANAGKTTILRKVCNAKPDAKPVIYDAEGQEVRQDPPKVCPENLIPFTEFEGSLGHFDSHRRSCCRGFVGRRRNILETPPTSPLMSSTLQRRLSKPNPLYNCF